MLAPGVRWLDDWFAVTEIAPGVIAIGEPRFHQINWNYLILGKSKALLFDTGPGVRDIAVAVAALTDLPVTALASHLHFDHTGNLHRFPDLAMADLPMLRACERAGVFNASEELFLGAEEGMVWQPCRVKHWWPVGHVIDLGGRALEIIATPGHSTDSIALLDRENNLLFAADYVYPGSLYAQNIGADLQSYAETAAALLPLLDDNTRILCSHGKPNAEGLHTAPVLVKADIVDLQNALAALQATGEQPTAWPVNARMKLLLAPRAFAAWQTA